MVEGRTRVEQKRRRRALAEDKSIGNLDCCSTRKERHSRESEKDKGEARKVAHVVGKVRAFLTVISKSSSLIYSSFIFATILTCMFFLFALFIK